MERQPFCSPTLILLCIYSHCNLKVHLERVSFLVTPAPIALALMAIVIFHKLKCLACPAKSFKVSGNRKSNVYFLYCQVLLIPCPRLTFNEPIHTKLLQTVTRMSLLPRHPSLDEEMPLTTPSVICGEASYGAANCLESSSLTPRASWDRKNFSLACSDPGHLYTEHVLII